MVRDGTIGKEERVLFLHTGGMPSLFAYEDVLDSGEARIARARRRPILSSR